jgi:hypothetical protein
VPVVAVSSGAKVLLHEASIIATKERAEMKMIEFFIARKLSLTALDIQAGGLRKCAWFLYPPILSTGELNSQL